RLDGEPRSVDLAHAPQRGGLPAPEGIHQSLLALLAAPAFAVAHVHADLHPRLLGLLAALLEEVLRIPSALPVLKDPRPARSARLYCRLAPSDHRHQERVAGRLQVADDRHRPESAVQQHKFWPDMQLRTTMQQAFDDVLHLLASAD